MARMIPLHMSVENPSRAERRLFRAFESDCLCGLVSTQRR